MKILVSFLMIVMVTSSAFAEPVTLLEKGQNAPFTGLLFDIPTANDTRKQLIELDGLRLINTSLNTSLVLQQNIITTEKSQVDLLIEQNNKLAVSLRSAESLNTYTKIGYFTMGLAAVLIGAYGIHKAAAIQ